MRSVMVVIFALAFFIAPAALGQGEVVKADTLEVNDVINALKRGDGIIQKHLQYVDLKSMEVVGIHQEEGNATLFVFHNTTHEGRTPSKFVLYRLNDKSWIFDATYKILAR